MHLLLIRLSLAYLLAGMVLGIAMAATGSGALRPVHAHVNPLGFLTLLASSVVIRLYSASFDIPPKPCLGAPS